MQIRSTVPMPGRKTVEPSRESAILSAARQMSATSDTERLANSAPLFGEYQPYPEVYDEACDPGAQARPHWQKFISSFEKLGRDELAVRWENGRRIIREHGVTYNIYGDPQGLDRPW